VSVKAQLKTAKSITQVNKFLLGKYHPVYLRVVRVCIITLVPIASFTKRVKKVLQIPADEVVDENEVLIERGVDSLVALDVRSWFLRELDVDMPVLKILGGNSIADLIKDSIERLPAALVDVRALPATAVDDDEVTGGAPVPAVGEPEPEPGGTAAVRTPRPNTPPKISIRNHSRIHELDHSHSRSRSRSHSHSTAPISIGTSISTPSNYAQDSSTADTAFPTSRRSIDKRSWREEVIESSKETTAPMSFGQTRFWFLYHALKDKTTSNIAISIRLTGRVKADSLDQALQAVAQKHEAMRTRYFWSGENMHVATQGVLSQPLVRLEQRRISSKAEADKALEEIRDYQWNLSDWEAMRFILLTLSDTQHWLIFGSHHITLDGVCIQIILADLEKAYQSQRLESLSERSKYRTYSTLQRKAHEDGKFRDAVEFYRKIIPANVEPIQLLPFSKSGLRKPQDSYR
jgi:hybrid polyketide synthase/nonribosomal peptide synthetase ACE1